MVSGIIFAFLAPFLWVGAALLDKFIVYKRVKNVLAYTAVTGIITLLFSGGLSLLISWEGIVLADVLLPLLAGALMGVFVYLYLWILQEEDVSDLLSFIYLYPVLVAAISFFILQEVLSLLGYIAVAVTMAGVYLLAKKTSSHRSLKGSVFIGCAITFLALWAFTVKVATNNIPELNAIVLATLAEGIMLLLILGRKDVRKSFSQELPNLGLGSLSEIFNNLGMVASFLAFARVPATVVVSITAIQPMLALILENLVRRMGYGISREYLLRDKLLPIALIVLGAATLAVTGVY